MVFRSHDCKLRKVIGLGQFYDLQLSAIISLRSAIAMIQVIREALPLFFFIFYMEVVVVKGSI